MKLRSVDDDEDGADQNDNDDGDELMMILSMTETRAVQPREYPGRNGFEAKRAMTPTSFKPV